MTRSRGLRAVIRGTLEERFWPKVDRSGGPTACWKWIAAVDPVTGYGRIGTVGKRVGNAHAVSWKLHGNEVPEGHQLDHLCRNRACVNPAHLEVVTKNENNRRGFSPTAINARKTHCKRGHEFTPENTYVRPRGRVCRTCHNARRRQAVT